MINLANTLPLAAPLSLQIDVSSACNFRCPMCPTGDPKALAAAGRKPRLMDTSLFVKIVRDLRGFSQPVAVIQLFKMGEPLMQKRLPSMVRYIKKVSPFTRVEITTNASLLTPARSRQLIEAGLDQIRISVEHVTADGYRQVTGNYTDYRTVLDNGRALWDQRQRMKWSIVPRIHAKIIDVGLTGEEKEWFFRDWRPISDECTISSLFAWPTDPDTALGMKPQTGIDGVTPINPDRIVCASPFKGMSIEADGVVTACCVDAKADTKLGDVRTQSLREIWDGPVMREFRLMQLRGERARNRACNGCSYVLGQHKESELDHARERLMEVYAQ